MIRILTVLRRSVFARMLLIFLIILIPLYFGGITIYSWGTQAVQKEISNSISSQGAAWVEGFEKEIERIRLLEYECLTAPDLDTLTVRAGTLSDMQRTDAVNRLLDRLAAIKSSSRYIDTARIDIPAIGRKLLSRGSITELNADDIKGVMADARLDDPLIFDGESARLIAAYPIQDRSGSLSTRYSVVVELSVAEIRKSIEELDGNGGRGYALMRNDSPILFSGLDGTDPVSMAASAYKAGIAGGVSAIEAGGKRYLASRAASTGIGLALYRFAPESEIVAPLNRYRLLFWLFTLAAIGIIVMFTIASKGLVDQAYRQKILAQKAELKQLQSQINPHFLYNSFFLLQNMVERGDSEGASAFTRQLGAYFQFVTRNASDEVALEREAAHARAYTMIQGRRFRGRIEVEFGELPPQLEGLMVPRLILQPVIENAFDHGLENKSTGGALRVSFEVCDDLLVACVEDNGDMTGEGAAALNVQMESGGDMRECTALVNIHRRLRLKYGPRSGMRFSSGDAGGLKAEILIPLDGGRDQNVQAARRR